MGKIERKRGEFLGLGWVGIPAPPPHFGCVGESGAACFPTRALDPIAVRGEGDTGGDAGRRDDSSGCLRRATARLLAPPRGVQPPRLSSLFGRPEFRPIHCKWTGWDLGPFRNGLCCIFTFLVNMDGLASWRYHQNFVAFFAL